MRIAGRLARLAAVVVAGATATAGAQPVPGRLQGLLRLPDVFGDAPCARYTPQPVPLYAAPQAPRPVGAIVVATPWTTDPAGGCQGLLVESRRGAHRAPLPTREIGYEESAAIVVEVADDGWLRVALDDTSAGWVRTTDATAYRPITTLLREGLTFLTAPWDGRLRDSPTSPSPQRHVRPPLDAPPVRVREYREVRGVTWVRVDVLSHSGCDSDGAPRVVQRGWLPLHHASGEPTVWFSSRGC